MKPNPLSLMSRLIVPFVGAIANLLEIHVMQSALWQDVWLLEGSTTCPKAGRRWMNAGGLTSGVGSEYTFSRGPSDSQVQVF
jgi:hypothetical protein